MQGDRSTRFVIRISSSSLLAAREHLGKAAWGEVHLGSPTSCLVRIDQGNTIRLARPIQHAAVIAGDHDKRVVAQSGFVERAQKLADHPIELMQKIAVRSTRARSDKTLGRRKRMMHVRRGKEEKEGFVLVRANPGHGFFRQRRTEFVVTIKIVGRFGARHSRSEHLLGIALRRRRAAVDQRVGRIESDDASVFDPNKGRVTTDNRNTIVVVESKL